jgi:ABC-type sugar transport system permease subunit
MTTRCNGQPAWAPWVLLAPFLCVFAVFTAYPLGRSLVLSLHQTYGPGTERYVGLDNYRFIASDPLFWKALRNTAVYTLGSVFVQLPLSLGLALLLNRPSVRARAAFRLAFFAPSLVGMVFVAMMFAVLFDKRTGLINVALHAATGPIAAWTGWDALRWDLDFAWLQDHVMAALVIASLWMWVGFNMIYFLAALQNVSGELLEAAAMDGAGMWRRFSAIVMPAIRPVAGFVVLLSIIGSLQLFELPWILLNNSGGPDNRGLTVMSYLYQTGFESGDLGCASAIGWILALVLILCAALQRFTARGETTE